MKRKITSLIMGIAIGIILTALIMSAGGTAASDKADLQTPNVDLVLAPDNSNAGTGDYEITQLVYKTETEQPFFTPNEDDVEMLAKTIWGEARGV